MNKQGLRIFLDDIRHAPEFYNKVFRSGEEFLSYVKDNNITYIDFISFDHDLEGAGGVIDGSDVIKGLVNIGVNFGTVQFHTDNNQGIQNMVSYIMTAKRMGIISIEEVNKYKINTVSGHETLGWLIPQKYLRE